MGALQLGFKAHFFNVGASIVNIKVKIKIFRIMPDSLRVRLQNKKSYHPCFQIPNEAPD